MDGNQINCRAIWPHILPPIDESDCNMTSSHIINQVIISINPIKPQINSVVFLSWILTYITYYIIGFTLLSELLIMSAELVDPCEGFDQPTS